MSKPDLDRLYWLLVIKGPLTMQEICAFTNWTRLETNSRLYYLRKTTCAELIERDQHRGLLNPCGKWKAITETEIIDAELIPA